MFKVDQYFLFKEGFDQLFFLMLQAERLSLGSIQSNNPKTHT